LFCPLSKHTLAPFFANVLPGDMNQAENRQEVASPMRWRIDTASLLGSEATLLAAYFGILMPTRCGYAFAFRISLGLFGCGG